ncbi:hypothetical protein F2P81_009875 [Scophthalmus maximus]|uniref:Uncharacterized protein n=1 Tax=Scophthalmus maximus TaxID=52904 RepID=A0A6A4T178_SCOMX|nr:hypothetical protein F2P81_009875 [Scophthalmus maximus]
MLVVVERPEAKPGRFAGWIRQNRTKLTSTDDLGSLSSTGNKFRQECFFPVSEQEIDSCQTEHLSSILLPFFLSLQSRAADVTGVRPYTCTRSEIGRWPRI